MDGRCRRPRSARSAFYSRVNPIPNAAPNYNAAPTDTLPVVRLDRDGRRSLDLLRWGLIPWWAKDAKIGSKCINAMSETVATKPAFRHAFNRGQRCIVPVHGFYEWQKRVDGKAALRDRRSRRQAIGPGGAVGALEGAE